MSALYGRIDHAVRRYGRAILHNGELYVPLSSADKVLAGVTDHEDFCTRDRPHDGDCMNIWPGRQKHEYAFKYERR